MAFPSNNTSSSASPCMPHFSKAKTIVTENIVRLVIEGYFLPGLGCIGIVGKVQCFGPSDVFVHCQQHVSHSLFSGHYFSHRRSCPRVLNFLGRQRGFIFKNFASDMEYCESVKV